MTTARIFPVVALTLLTAPAFGADANGYTPQYECRAGNPKCDVDVAALANQSCQQIIQPSDPWSSINWSNSVICIAAGDHTAKGTLVITASGTASTRKVLRYYRPQDVDDEPWRQTNADKAKILQIQVTGSYWILHRLTVDGNGTNTEAWYAFSILAGASNNVINRLYVTNGSRLVAIAGTASPSTTTNNTVQNSVIRDSVRRLADASSNDASCLKVGNGIDNAIVNNEIYHCHESAIQTWGNALADGTKIENNDIYVAEDQFTDCSGNYTPTNPNSPCADTEDGVVLKAGGSQAKPYIIIHNRIWNFRHSDNNVCCFSGAPGVAVSLSTNDDRPATDGTKWTLVKDNIIASSQYAIQSPRELSERNSAVGNIIYNINEYNASWGASSALDTLGHWDNNEVYLNTIVRATKNWAQLSSGNGNLDVRCNAVIDSGPNAGSDTPDAGTQVDYNIFYGTTQFSANGVNRSIEKALRARANSTFYAVGDIIRVGPVSACTAGSNSECFLYKVTAAGTSSVSSPNYCTTLGCTTTDGGMTVQAIRGPYIYRRKLRTVPGGELAVVPYAAVAPGAPEYGACDPGIGTRQGVGIADISPL
jgi:hypothetical protein